MRPSLFIHSLTFLLCCSAWAQELKKPDFEDIISLQSVSNPVISPDGGYIVFEQSATDWEKNSYDTELWISKKEGNVYLDPIALTNNAKGSSSNPKWSPDGTWIAFISKRGEKVQLYVIRASGGEAFQVTNASSGIAQFEWAPDGQSIAFLQSEDKEKEEKKLKDRYGAFDVDDKKFYQKQLWRIPFNPSQLYHHPLPKQLKDSAYKEALKAKLMLDTTGISINKFLWSPDGKHIAIEHQPNPLINSFFKADISLFDVQNKSLSSLVSNPSYDGLSAWSPDGKMLLYQTSLEDTTSNYYSNGHLFKINTDGSGNTELAADFDEELNNLQWNEQGIFALAWQKTDRQLWRIDPKKGSVQPLSAKSRRIRSYTFTADGKQLALSGVNNDDLFEIYTANYPLKKLQKLTNTTAQIKGWAVSNSEMISWESEDGQVIEGVLHKPQDYDPDKKYPLLVIIHGGPTGISVPSPTPSYVYPMVQWLNKGALILQPNYRGSAGYGEKFRSLNVRNLGVGDAWDVLSGVEHLKKQGLVDADKIGCMGWSQGGYISAFLTTNSDMFKAISVGAGISNWMTYYVNTDIHPFTRQYLKATPWSDEAIYKKTSPMTTINNASTPTLIQHGEFDRRVPIANAYELLQGLRDVGVESKLVVYKGFGHGINKPKERLAATWHNWQWFAKYLWDEEVSLPEE